jgi:signal transduction histidine kinase
MRDKTQCLVFERGLAFFGRMTAGISHELKNALSIINELTGLMDDLLLGGNKGREIPPAQLAKIAEGIGRQVQRSDGLIKRLHHFSHNADDFQTTAPLGALVEEIAALCRRLADLKRVRLVVELGEGSSVCVSRMFLWQHVIYECIRIALEEAGDGDSVSVGVSNTESAHYVRIAGSRPVARGVIEREMPLLEALVEELGSTLGIEEDGGIDFRITLSPPM